MSQPPAAQAIYRSNIAKLATTLTLGMLATHLLIVRQDHKITILCYLAMSAVAVIYAIHNYLSRSTFRQVRYGSFMAHLTGYLIVVGSFYLHAAYLLLSNQRDLIDTAWFGPLFGMGLFWGLGLAIHTAGTIATRGFEDVRI